MASDGVEATGAGGVLGGVEVRRPETQLPEGDGRRWDTAHERVCADTVDGMVYFNDTFYMDVHDLVLELGYFPSRGVFATYERTLGLDPYLVAGLVEDDAYEDYSMDDSAYESIVDFCRTWTDKFGETVHEVDYARAVVAPDDTRPVTR